VSQDTQKPIPVTVREATVRLMRNLEMTTIFGNPGSTELAFLDDLPPDIRYVLALQEASAVGMADGYAQATGRAAFVNVHCAAGLGNALGSIFTAFKNQTPLVITAGQQVRSMLPLDPYLGATRPTEFPRPYVKWACEPARAEDVPTAIEQGYSVAMQHPRGPVFISIPCDDWIAMTVPVTPRKLVWEFGPDQELLSQLGEAINQSVLPAFVLGPAVDREGAYDLGVALAERANAPVWESPVSSRGSFPETHRLFAGFLPAVPEKLSEILEQYDLIVVVGAPVFTFHVPGKCAVLTSGVPIYQITDDPLCAAQSAKATTVLGTMKPSLTALIELIKPGARTSQPAVRPHAPPVSGSSPIKIEFVMHTLAQVIPEEAVIVEEAASHRPAMQRYLPIRQSGGFYTMASGGLGYGLPAAVGVALGQSRRVVCLMGDGGMMYSVQALWTAVQHKVPLTVIVLRNGGYGAMKSFARQLKSKGPPPGVELPGLDFEALAAGFGFKSVRAGQADILAETLKRAFDEDGPILVEIAVDPDSGSIY